MNIEKLMLLAALTPFVVAGIAQRASDLGADAEHAAQVVAATVATGAICAVLGALGFGWLADRGEGPGGRLWAWVLVATVLGTIGLATAMIPSAPALLGG